MDYVFVVLGLCTGFDGQNFTDVLLVTPSDELSARCIQEWKNGVYFLDYSRVWRIDIDVTLP